LGFKNGTDGNLHTAINAIKAASHPQTFLGISHEGQASAVTTRGNPNCHIVLRGGTGGPNFDSDSIRSTEGQLTAAGLMPSIMVDCSHENSGKQPDRQPEVMGTVLEQVTEGSDSLIGVMIESHLEAGSQSFPAPLESLKPGVSITDGCIDWATTEQLLLQAHEALSARFR
jgi:3-deoxy-7-phosphoheptulonate synthase